MHHAASFPSCQILDSASSLLWLLNVSSSKAMQLLACLASFSPPRAVHSPYAGDAGQVVPSAPLAKRLPGSTQDWWS